MRIGSGSRRLLFIGRSYFCKGLCITYGAGTTWMRGAKYVWRASRNTRSSKRAKGERVPFHDWPMCLDLSSSGSQGAVGGRHAGGQAGQHCRSLAEGQRYCVHTPSRWPEDRLRQYSSCTDRVTSGTPSKLRWGKTRRRLFGRRRYKCWCAAGDFGIEASRGKPRTSARSSASRRRRKFRTRRQQTGVLRRGA